MSETVLRAVNFGHKVVVHLLGLKDIIEKYFETKNDSLPKMAAA